MAEKKKILIADDDASIRLLVRSILSKNYTVIEAADGQEALKATQQHKPSLVLMDVFMPKMNGLEATRTIRAREKESGQHIPVIAITAYDTREDKDKCLAAGMDYCLSKPVNFKELCNAIELFLFPNPDIQEVEDLHSAPSVDFNEALLMVGGDKDLLREAIELFLEESRGHLEDLDEAVKRQDGEAIECLAHGLRGALSTFGAHAARNLAYRLETMARKDDLRGAQGVLRQFKMEIQRGLRTLIARCSPIRPKIANGKEEVMNRKARILVVDDNRSLTRIMERILQKEGFEPLIAFDGEAGLQKAREEKPDLIILDVVMPGMDGYQVCRYLQEDSNTARIPVVMISVKGRVDEEGISPSEVNRRVLERLEGFAVGAANFLSKPIRTENLLERVRLILSPGEQGG